MPDFNQSPELARAWQQYFRVRGGAAPTLPSDILPVVILDDNSRGPYAAHRAWVAGIGQGALAANFTFVGILNADPLGASRSAVVVDQIYVRLLVADDMAIGLTTPGVVPLAGPLQSVADAIQDKEATTGAPLLGNVQVGQVQQVAAFGSLFPNNTTTLQRIDGPWTLGPQTELVIRPLSVNAAIAAFFRGRYYPPI